MNRTPSIRVTFAGAALPAELLAAFRLAPDITPPPEPLDWGQLVAGTRRQRPDVVLVDLGGVADEALTAMAEMMVERPVPMLALYSPNGHGDSQGKAIQVGAVETMPRPAVWTAAHAEAVCERIRVLRGVAVMPRRKPPVRQDRRSARGRIVAIGASTGGPTALATVLAGLGGLPAAILIVQHLRPEFLPQFVDWLARTSPMPVVLAGNGGIPLEGVAYLAPHGVHLRLAASGLMVLGTEPQSLHRPSVDELFYSVAKVAGDDAVGVVLTGMGRDGAAGLLEMRRRGAVTIAQDEASSAVFGMPKSAWDIGAARAQLPLTGIGAAIQVATRRVMA